MRPNAAGVRPVRLARGGAEWDAHRLAHVGSTALAWLTKSESTKNRNMWQRFHELLGVDRILPALWNRLDQIIAEVLPLIEDRK